MATANDYILVKDENGDLKYFKDGQYFNLDDIDKPQPTVQEVTAARSIRDIKITPEPEDREVSMNSHLDDHRKELNDRIKSATQAVITDLKVNFTDENTKRRFFDLIASRLREVRTDKEVAYSLTVPKADGGFGLDEEKATLVVTVIKKHEADLHETKKEVISKVEIKKDLPIPEPGFEPVKRTAPAPVVNTKFIDDLIAKEKKSDSIADLIKPKAQSQPTPSMKPPTRIETAKAVNHVADVKYRPKSFGPVEEIEFMELDDFHRLGNNPADILKVLTEKLEVLKQESWKKGTAGILAWKKSPVFNIFMEMGHQSLLSGKKMSDVIVDRQINNKPSLTQSEFDAILEFNQTLEI